MLVELPPPPIPDVKLGLSCGLFVVLDWFSYAVPFGVEPESAIIQKNMVRKCDE